MKILIQFTGAQSTGKTTLATKLVSYYEEVARPCYFVGETSRTLKAKNLISEVGVKASALSQILINSELLLQYYEALNDSLNRIIIAERTPICCAGYMQEIEPFILSEQVDYMVRQTYRFLESTVCIPNVKKLTFYCPLNIPYVKDGIRDEESRLKIDRNIQQVIEDYHIPVIEVPAGSIDERFNFVLSKIKEVMND